MSAQIQSFSFFSRFSCSFPFHAGYQTACCACVFCVYVFILLDETTRGKICKKRLKNNVLSYKQTNEKLARLTYSATRLTVATQQTFLQVSQSRYANLIDRHASIKSFNTQLPNENLSILTNKVEAKA